MQKLPEVQLTPSRVSAWLPDGAAMGTNRQLVPFQISVP